MSELPRHLLPASLLEIADYCGDDTMWKIWSAYAGMRLSVPMTMTPEHPLSQLLGYAAACQLSQAFGGAEPLTIARAEAARRAVRNEMMRQDHREGMSHCHLVRKYGLTDRQISTIINAVEPLMLNMDLFEI
ncbi:Mor transcription activator family protein [Methylobacter sp.]|uniref:Mor transcription activator family protein n=1 Tax=Methylobacter sp. TaxID=2051955 RepID=UPI00248729AB|nr:Mor transcription activator family protein [Methylobacter sp.]MDI1278061.1 Mor transcription activator family protein [Methylobacter sp.]